MSPFNLPMTPVPFAQHFPLPPVQELGDVTRTGRDVTSLKRPEGGGGWVRFLNVSSWDLLCPME